MNTAINSAPDVMLDVQFGTTRKRWLQIGMVMSLICYNHFTLSVFLPLLMQIQIAYDLKTAFTVSLCAIIWNLQTIPTTFICIWAFKHYESSTVLRFFACLQLLGAWVRPLNAVTGTFMPHLVGTIIQAMTATAF